MAMNRDPKWQNTPYGSSEMILLKTVSLDWVCLKAGP